VPTPGSGYEPVLTTMNLWNYDYNSRENKGKQRRHTIVLQKQDNQLNNLALETFRREGNLKDNKMDVAINLDDLLSIGNSATLNYSQTADYENAIKHLPDPKFGSDGWTGTKYAHVIGCMPYQNVPRSDVSHRRRFMEPATHPEAAHYRRLPLQHQLLPVRFRPDRQDSPVHHRSARDEERHGDSGPAALAAQPDRRPDGTERS